MMVPPVSSDLPIIKKELPWWTWVLPILLFHLGTEVSLNFKYEEGVSTFYLPTGILLILLNWWGPWRTIPAMFINAAISTPLWGVENPVLWLIYPIPETIFGVISWNLYNRLLHGKADLNSTKDLLRFTIFALTIPLLIELIGLQLLSNQFKDPSVYSNKLFWEYVMRNWIGEFIANFGIALCFIYFLSPVLSKAGLTWYGYNPVVREKDSKEKYLYLLGICLVVYLSSGFLAFQEFWYIYGFAGLAIALTLGFRYILIYNVFVFILTYVLPEFNAAEVSIVTYNEKIYYIFLGNLLLSVFSTATGSIFRDLNLAKNELLNQKLQLERTNAELDRFVYSVSHDISAPLKSIQGLVNLLKQEKSPENQHIYIDKIQHSIVKQENFIQEILQYSRNNRVGIELQTIDLRKFCLEILEDYKYHNDFEAIDLKIDVTHQIVSDVSRVRIVLQNLLGNALKFRRQSANGPHSVAIFSTELPSGDIELSIHDNGEGIHPDEIKKIFEMFYRASVNSMGSGLGLYIAKLAADKISATISVVSAFGSGSTFTVTFPPSKSTS